MELGSVRGGGGHFLAGGGNHGVPRGARLVGASKMTADLKEAPLTVNKEDVAQAAVDAALSGERFVFVHKLFWPISTALQLIPAPIMRRLSF